MNQKMKDILRPTIKELRDMIFMLRKNALTMAAVIALILILVIALLAPVIVPYPQDIADKTNLSENSSPLHRRTYSERMSSGAMFLVEFFTERGYRLARPFLR